MQTRDKLIENDHKCPRLQPRVWTDTIAFELWHQFQLKCPFVFRKGQIHENGYYYATMVGQCKSKQCRNPLFGYIEKNSGDQDSVFVRLQCYDTRFVKNEEVKRPLQS